MQIPGSWLALDDTNGSKKTELILKNQTNIVYLHKGLFIF